MHCCAGVVWCKLGELPSSIEVDCCCSCPSSICAVEGLAATRQCVVRAAPLITELMGLSRGAWVVFCMVFYVHDVQLLCISVVCGSLADVNRGRSGLGSSVAGCMCSKLQKGVIDCKKHPHEASSMHSCHVLCWHAP